MPLLQLTVHFHDGRYHGTGDWPPSPARLFQALVAGGARGARLSEPARVALLWLETLPPPEICVPAAVPGQAVKSFVPNNDLDTVGGDPAKVGDIRAPKLSRPRHFEAALPLIYRWEFAAAEPNAGHARSVCDIAEQLYQLGRGLDLAWARGQVLSSGDGHAASDSGCSWWRPSQGGDGALLACPQEGTLASLVARYEAFSKRFQTVGSGKKTSVLFAQAPKPRFAQVRYESRPERLLFELRAPTGDLAFAPQRQETAVALTEEIRDEAAKRLKGSSWRKGDPKRDALAERVFIGSKDSGEADKGQRLCITPLPSIGFRHTERSIRRVLVTIPANCPLPASDVAWAFSGLSLVDKSTGAVGAEQPTGQILAELVGTDDRTMLGHYGIEGGMPGRRWRTVTPAALPGASRRRIDPNRTREEAKSGSERAAEEGHAIAAVRNALRHAGIGAVPQSIRVQREPFEGKGARAETFAAPPRFAKERLWHVELGFAEPQHGPLIIGDGRYLGLGLMSRVHETQGVFAFGVSGDTRALNHLSVTRALRRAVMARVQDVLPPRVPLPEFFTGHAPDGAPLRSGNHRHLAFVFDAPRQRILVVAPHVLERRDASRDKRNLATLEDALAGFSELRIAGGSRLSLAPTLIDAGSDPLHAPASVWESLTPYRVTRHLRAGDAAAALEADLRAELERCGYAKAQIEVLGTESKRGLGLFGRARLTFRTVQRGPLLLGRDRHFGGGLFAPLA